MAMFFRYPMKIAVIAVSTFLCLIPAFAYIQFCRMISSTFPRSFPLIPGMAALVSGLAIGLWLGTRGRKQIIESPRRTLFYATFCTWIPVLVVSMVLNLANLGSTEIVGGTKLDWLLLVIAGGCFWSIIIAAVCGAVAVLGGAFLRWLCLKVEE